jgi:hypothetical protein
MGIIVINGRVNYGHHYWMALDVNIKSNIQIYTLQRLAEVLLQ